METLNISSSCTLANYKRNEQLPGSCAAVSPDEKSMYKTQTEKAQHKEA